MYILCNISYLYIMFPCLQIVDIVSPWNKWSKPIRLLYHDDHPHNHDDDHHHNHHHHNHHHHNHHHHNHHHHNGREAAVYFTLAVISGFLISCSCILGKFLNSRYLGLFSHFIFGAVFTYIIFGAVFTYIIFGAVFTYIMSGKFWGSLEHIPLCQHLLNPLTPSIG